MIKYLLPNLPYPSDALEPYLDGRTMEIHHSKHHQAYVNNLNTVLEKYQSLPEQPLEQMLTGLARLPFEEKDRNFFKNNAGGHLNHAFFWQIMGPAKEIDKDLISEVQEKFGSVEEFKKQFTKTATAHFGSGWTWLVRTPDKNLKIYSLPNQDSPYLTGDTPIIALDLWEHAYYLKYQNRRPEYIENWWHVLKLL